MAVRSPPASPTININVEPSPRTSDNGSRDSSPEPEEEAPDRKGLSVPGRLQSRGSLSGRKSGTGAAVLHNTDLAKIANEEWQALLKGEKYYCQLVMANSPEPREVILNVNLSGIRLLDRKTEAIINQFDIEQILQYSYSQQNSTFSFSYLEEGRFFVTHKFISKDYFEIHQYLGNAIAIVIKLKTQIKKNGPSETLNMIDTQRAERAHSYDTLRRSSRAKLYFEQKYKSAKGAQAEPVEESRSTESLTEGAEAAGGDEKAGVAGSHLQSLFVPPTATAPNDKRGGDSAKNYVEEQYRKYKEYTRDGSSETTPEEEEEDVHIKEPRRASRVSVDEQLRRVREPEPLADGSNSSGSLKSAQMRASDSMLSLSSSSLKGNDSMRKKEKQPKPGGSIRFGRVDFDNFIGSIGSLRKKGTSKPMTPEEIEKQKYRKSIFESTSVNLEELPEQKIKTDSAGRARLIKSMLDGHYQITAGTIDGLVEALADENAPDTLFIDDFLLTYRNFMTASVFFDKLIARFHIKPSEVPTDKKEKVKKDKDKEKDGKIEDTVLDSNNVSLVRARVLSVFKKWVDRHWYDFEPPEMRERLNTFIGEIKASEYQIVAQQILSFVGANEKRKQASIDELPPPNMQPNSVDFSTLVAKDVAQHLTVVAIRMFQKILPDEFVIYLWGKKDQKLTQEMTRHLNRFIDRFNNVGFWVATEICAVADLKKRIAVMEKFIAIAKYCFRNQNFNDVIAILSGLNTIPIYRLKKTWAGVSPKFMTIFRDLESKMSPESNYKVYRALEFEAKPPLIPFFGLYMKDLTFMNDGNQTFLSGDLVNFEKNRAIMGKIMAIRVSQQSVFQFELNDELLHYCEVIYHKEEEVLTEESYVLEPSNRRRRASISESVNSEVSVSTANSEETASAVSEIFD